MRKMLALLIAGLLGALLLSGCSGGDNTKELTLSGTGSATTTPDTTTVQAVVKSEAATNAAATAQANGVTAKVVGAVKAKGVAPAQIKTQNVVTSQDTDRNVFTASITLSVTVPQKIPAGGVIDAITAAGANQVSVTDVTTKVKDPREYQTAAQQDAFNALRKQAESLAKVSGQSLGPVKTISDGSNSDATPSGGLARTNTSGAGTEVQAGESSVTAYLTVTWELQ